MKRTDQKRYLGCYKDLWRQIQFGGNEMLTTVIVINTWDIKTTEINKALDEKAESGPLGKEASISIHINRPRRHLWVRA